jgi:hypothetical protein
MMGNGVWCHAIPVQEAYETLEAGDAQGGRKSVKEDLERISYLGKANAMIVGAPGSRSEDTSSYISNKDHILCQQARRLEWLNELKPSSV